MKEQAIARAAGTAPAREGGAKEAPARQTQAAQAGKEAQAPTAQMTQTAPAVQEREVGRCPRCGASMQGDEKQGYLCPYCGTRTAAVPARGEGGQGAASAEGPAPQRAAADARPVERRYGAGYFTASRIAKLALLTALAYVVTFLEFPLFPAAPFLQLDFSNVFVLLGGFMYGPVAAVVVSAAKELLSLLDTGTGGVGEIANFLLTFSFVIVPTLVYRRKKGIKTVTATLAAGCLLLVAAGLAVNRYINFPLYMGEGAAESFAALWWYIVLFNLIKGVAVSAVTVLLYKRVSRLMKKF